MNEIEIVKLNISVALYDKCSYNDVVSNPLVILKKMFIHTGPCELYLWTVYEYCVRLLKEEV